MKLSNCQRCLMNVLLGFTFLAGNAFAQTGTISGTVRDRQSGEPLPGANVIVNPISNEGRVFGSASDASGKFLLSGITPGTYTIKVSYIGYLDFVLADVTIASGTTRTVDALLTQTTINVNPLSVTASRRPEKVLDAPASVNVIESAQIETRPALTVTDHLENAPAVDIAAAGMVSSTIVVRGFNNIFSGALLVLTDNRIARVPSLRVNTYSMIPSANEDIERVEIVSGPGSALYGPNSASGVLHIITKSPFTSKGTSVSLGTGWRSHSTDDTSVLGRYANVFTSSFRHASELSERVAFKLSGQYFEGEDWTAIDPSEPRRLQLGRQTATGRVAVGDTIDNVRPNRVKKAAFDARFDFRLSDEATLIVNGAMNRVDQIELTGIGAGLAKGWTYSYAQARFNYKDLFVQGFLNASDAGDTYILRTGDLIVDKSKLLVGQVQHGLSFGEHQRFTYGIDALFTRPATDNTINGRNENNDDINELGVYLQSESQLSPKFTLVGAARIDKHNRLEKAVFSPRAALVFKPKAGHSLRATYNRAFSTPTSNNLFLDILSLRDFTGVGSLLQPSLGFNAGTDVRAQGVPESGFHFSRSANGLPQFRSPFAPLAGRSASDYLDMNDPVFTNVMWGVAAPLVTAGLQAQFRPALVAQGFNDATINQLFSAFSASILPKQISGAKNRLASLNPVTQQFDPVADAVDVQQMKETVTETFEAGYKGIIANKLVVALDVYRTSLTDFVGPLIVETPNVFLETNSMLPSLVQQFQANLDASTNFLLKGVLSQLDLAANGGNANGTPADELAFLFASSAAGIPFGTVSPREAFDPTAVILTYRNFGNIDLWGSDVSFTYFVNNGWSIGGNFSYVSKDFFPKTASQPHDVALNAPDIKFGAYVQYLDPRSDYNFQVRYRHVDDFPVNSGVYLGEIKAYDVVDLNVGYRLAQNTHISVAIQNLFDNFHQEMIGAPKIGRLGLVQLRRTF